MLLADKQNPPGRLLEVISRKSPWGVITHLRLTPSGWKKRGVDQIEEAGSKKADDSQALLKPSFGFRGYAHILPR